MYLSIVLCLPLRSSGTSTNTMPGGQYHDDDSDVNDGDNDLYIDDNDLNDDDNDLNDDDELRTTCKRQSCSLSAHCRQSQVCKLI